MNQDNQGEAGTVQHGAPQGSMDELNSLNGCHPQYGDFGNQSVTVTEQPVVTLNQLGHGPDSFEFLDSILTNQDNQAVTGTVQPAAPQVVSEVPFSVYGPDLSEFLDLTGINQNNQAIAGTGQPDLPQGFDLQGSSETLDTVSQTFKLPSIPPLTGTERLDDPLGSIVSKILETIGGRYLSKDLFEKGMSEHWYRGFESHHKQEPLIRQTSTSAREQTQLSRKREIDRAYRQRKKAKTEALEVENQQLKTFEAEVGRLNDEIQGNKFLMKSELMKLLDQNWCLEAKILQLQGHNGSVNHKLEAQSMKLDQLQDKLEFMQQLTTDHLDEQRNGKAKETLKEMAKKLEASRAEHKEMVAAVKLEETLLRSLLSEVQSIKIQIRRQIDQLPNEMPHNAGEEDSAIFQNS